MISATVGMWWGMQTTTKQQHQLPCHRSRHQLRPTHSTHRHGHIFARQRAIPCRRATSDPPACCQFEGSGVPSIAAATAGGAGADGDAS